jgi:hypothetical protein
MLLLKLGILRLEKRKILRSKLVLNYKLITLCALLGALCPSKAAEKPDEVVAEQSVQSQVSKSKARKLGLALKAAGCGVLSLVLGGIGVSTLPEHELSWVIGKKQFSELELSKSAIKGGLLFCSYELALIVINSIQELRK